MKETHKPICFFTPSLNRSGSELVLWNLLKSQSDRTWVRLFCKFRGTLYNEASRLFNTVSIYDSQFPTGFPSKLFRRLFGKIRLESVLKTADCRLWYINTILLPDILEFAARKRIDIVLHVHELEHMYKLLDTASKERLLTYPKLIIANSQTSADVLLAMNVKVPVKVIYPVADLKNFVFNQHTYESARNKSGIKDEFIWIMSGTLDENKNPPLFLDIANKLQTVSDNFRMIWLAPHSPPPEMMHYLQSRTTELGLEKRVLWIMGSENYLNYFNSADGFVLTSKLESFSLVTLEALSLGLPLVANNCRGVIEITGHSYGHIVEGENAELMCKAMQEVMLKGKIRHTESAGKILARFDGEVIQRQWLQTIQELNRL